MLKNRPRRRCSRPVQPLDAQALARVGGGFWGGFPSLNQLAPLDLVDDILDGDLQEEEAIQLGQFA